jgi:hypothetical protein
MKINKTNIGSRFEKVTSINFEGPKEECIEYFKENDKNVIDFSYNPIFDVMTLIYPKDYKI